MKIATLISVLLFLLSSAANSFAKNEAEPTAPSFSPSPYGGSGLIHLSKAETSPNNKYFLTLQFNYFSQDSFISSGIQRRFKQTLSLTTSPFKHLQTWFNLAGMSSTNSKALEKGSAAFIQNIGDLDMGLKYAHPLRDTVTIGFDAGIQLFSGINSLFFDLSSTSFLLNMLTRWEMQQLVNQPITTHFMAGFHFDNRKCLTNKNLNPIDQFAFNRWLYHQFNFALGAEYFFPDFTPFAEYSLVFPYSIPDRRFRNANLSSEDSNFFSRTIHRLALGVKSKPRKNFIFGLGVIAAHAADQIEGIPLHPRFSVDFSISYQFSSSDKKIKPKNVKARGKMPGTAVKPKVKVPPSPGEIMGIVMAAKDNKPAKGATVTPMGYKGRTVQVNQKGYFSLPHLKSGKITLKFDGHSYLPTKIFRQVKPGKKSHITVELALKKPVPGEIHLLAENDKGKKLTGKVTIKWLQKTSKTDKKPPLSFSFKGELTLKLQPGEYQLILIPEKYPPWQQIFSLKAGEKSRFIFKYSLKTEKKIVTKTVKIDIKKSKIELSGKIHFLTGLDTIMPDSKSILDDLAKTLHEHPEILKIRVDGHTDNRGKRKFNLKLSKKRATAVKNYLAKKGIVISRLDSKGYGPDFPVASNASKNGREKNRRVEFTILKLKPSGLAK